jgi:S1-C subfamily serine protease
MGHLLVIALIVVFGGGLRGEDQPKPPVPDPFGLGERLALIDHLRETWKIEPPPSATLEQLEALYWKHAKPVPPTLDEDAALAADRMRRLRGELKERYRIEAPAEADEATLGALLAEARTEATGKAVKKVLDQAAARDNPATPEEAAKYAGQDRDAVRTRLSLIDQDERSDRADVERIERQRQELAKQGAVVVAGLEHLRNRHSEAITRHNHLVNLYNKKVLEGSTDALLTLEQIHAQKRVVEEAVAAVELQTAELAKLEASDAELAAKRARIDERLAGHDQRRAEERRKLEAAGGDDDVAGPTTPGGAAAAAAAGSQEAKLVAAVVLLMVPNRGSGTGFVVSKDGLIVTNAHVLGGKGVKPLALWDAGANRQPVPLRVVDYSEADDLALLKAESGAPFQPLPMSEIYELSRPLRAVGFPLASSIAGTFKTSPSDIVITGGSLNSARKNDAGRVEWLQHDCKIASGNSGGPLIDQATGAVIGVNTRAVKPDGTTSHGDSMSFAIPIRKVQDRFAIHFRP